LTMRPSVPSIQPYSESTPMGEKSNDE
jgi:hypothetical protein